MPLPFRTGIAARTARRLLRRFFSVDEVRRLEIVHEQSSVVFHRFHLGEGRIEVIGDAGHARQVHFDVLGALDAVGERRGVERDRRMSSR